MWRYPFVVCLAAAGVYRSTQGWSYSGLPWELTQARSWSGRPWDLALAQGMDRWSGLP